MTTSLFPLLAFHMPSMTTVLISIVGTVLPVMFFLWMNWWLSSIKDENPDQVLAAQEKADKEHRAHHGHHGQGGHGHGHGHGHGGHAHA